MQFSYIVDKYYFKFFLYLLLFKKTLSVVRLEVFGKNIEFLGFRYCHTLKIKLLY